MLRGSHEPDVEAISTYADGALEPRRAAVLEEHLAGCPACRARLEELRGLRTMLAAMPRPEPRRSFRLRPSDAAAPAPAPSRSPWVAAMPAISAAAIIVFGAVLAADFTTRDDGGGLSADRQAAGQRSMEGDDASAGGAGEFAPDAPTACPECAQADGAPAASVPPSGAVAPDSGATSADADATAKAMADGAAREAPTTLSGFQSNQSSPEAAEQPVDSAATSPSGELQEEQIGRAEDDDDDGGSRTAFVIAEIAAAAVAVMAAGTFIASRIRRRNLT